MGRAMAPQHSSHPHLPRGMVHGQSGGMRFEPNVATGGALGGVDQHEPSGGSGGMPPGSTTIMGGDVAHHVVHMPDASSGESPGLQTSTGMLGTVSGDALSGGVVAGDSQVEGFVTPRSQQGLPTIAEMVEGFPASGLQLMTKVGDFFRVAHTEVVQVPAVLQGTHTPHHPEKHHHKRVIVRAVLQGPWLWEMGVWVHILARHHSWEHMVHQHPLHRIPEGMALC